MRIDHQQRVLVREVPMEQTRQPFSLQCLYGPHLGEVMHKGTIYCRKCYDERNPFNQLIN